jgi:hypothetical protein
VIAVALIDGDTNGFWSAVANLVTVEEKMCDIWSVLCRLTPQTLPPEVAGCIAGAFARTGMPLSPPFALRRANAIEHKSIDDGQEAGENQAFMDERADPPLYIAVRFSPSMAHALLDLPSECGLDVNTCIGDSLSFDYDPGPAIGATNYTNYDCASLFDRLLRRTDRSVISAGCVYVDQNCVTQFHRASTHVLVATVLRSRFPVAAHGLLLRVKLFVDMAQSDGGGTDLTGGVTRRGAAVTNNMEANDDAQVYGPTPHELWPRGQFRGALDLADRLCHWWSSPLLHQSLSTNCKENAATILAQLAAVRNYLLDGMRRIRAYRLGLVPATSRILRNGQLCERGLCTLVLSYVLVPLHDESQLQDPLLD